MRKKLFLLLATSLLLGCASSRAAVKYWDLNGATAGSGGPSPAGAWNTTSANWSTSSAGTAATTTYLDTDSAVFCAGTDATGSYAVTLASTRTAVGLTVEEGTLQLSGSSLTIGTAGVTVNGGAQLTVSGSISVGTGLVTVNTGGKLSLSGSSAMPATSGSIVSLNGSTLENTTTGAAGSFINAAQTITVGAQGGILNFPTANTLNIVQSGTPGTIISGAGGITVSGAGVLAVATACTYAGPTIVNNGELRIRNTSNRLPIATDVTVNSPGIFNVNAVVASPGGQQIGSLAGNGPVGLGSSTLIIAGANSTTYSGVIQEIANAGAAGYSGTGHGSVTKDGASTLTLSGVNTYQGTFTLSNGVVNVSLGASLCGPICDVVVRNGFLNFSNVTQTIENLSGTGGTINMTAGNTLVLSNISSATYSGTIGGSGILKKIGVSTEILSGPNSYSGNTLVTGGRLQVASATALGSIAGFTDVSSGAELLFDGVATSFIINELISIAGNGAAVGEGAIFVQNNANVTFGGPITLTGDSIIGVSSTGTTVLNGSPSVTSAANQNLTLAGGSGAGGGGTIPGPVNLGNGGLTKTNAGTWSLNGTCTYNGPTKIIGGTLRVNGSLNGGSAVSATNGTLAGTGTISGPVTILGGTAPGTLAPGSGGIGTLTINGTLTLLGGATMELNRTATPNNSDRATGMSSVTYGGTLTVLNIGPVPQAGDTFQLFSAAGYGGSFSTVTLPTLTAGLVWDTSLLGVSGKIQVVAQIVLTCSTNITVSATSGSGAVVNYTSSATGGCTPPVVNCTPASGSTFPVGTTLVTCTAQDSCGTITNCSFQVTVNPAPAAGQEQFAKDSALPPTNTVYISPDLYHVLFANGIVIKDIAHDAFTASHPTPPLGNTIVHVFSSDVGFDISTDNGATYSHVSATANAQVQVAHSFDSGGIEHYDNEMQALDFTVGTGAGPVMLRESPTLQSTGQTTVRPVAGGYLIASFFDIWTEVSTDGGASWVAASNAAHVEMRNDPNAAPEVAEPTSLLPPPQDKYVSPEQWHALFAQGIVIKDVSHRFFTQSLTPGTSGTNTEAFNSQVGMQISLDGGATYQYVDAAAPVNVTVTHVGSATSGRYDTEMTGLSLSGLPGGLMIRESPSLPSRGITKIEMLPDGTWKMHSFFDIFPEVSTDGGASWSPATNGPVRMQLTKQAAESTQPTSNLPPPAGQYVSPDQWHALYANGIIITNSSHDRFTQTQPPPPPGSNTVENFGSRVQGQISMDGGATFQPFSALANVMVQVNSRSDEDSGNTRYFDTEMLQLDISGGSLPAGVMVRESPSKASLGRTSIRQDPGTGQYYIGSFFDIFTEVSLDGGASWSPTVSPPGTMGLQTNGPGPAPLTVICPSNITVAATSPAGAVVFYSVSTSGGCPPVSVVANPPSGSTFPIGTTTVTVNASDACGNSATCSFTVTVTPQVSTAPEYFSPTDLLPPTNSVYISPALWHVLYNNGIVIRDIRHRFFTQQFPPPPLGATQVHSFSSEVDFAISLDNGTTFAPGSGTANVTVQVTHTSDDASGSHFDTEMLQLDLTGSGFMLRESPTLQSKGKTSIRQVPGGNMIGSFFDVFTEISTDGGATWMPAQNSGHVELRNDPDAVAPVLHPTDLLPPPNGAYVSPQQWHALFAQGIVIKDVSHKFFTDSQHPPTTGNSNVESFNSVVDLSISTDGGNTFQVTRVSAPVTISVVAQGSASSRFYDTEMLQLDLTGLPGGIMIRESPSLPSRGGTSVRTSGLPAGDPDYDLLRIGSFFDIFPEVSLDGGASWQPATNGPVRMQLTQVTPNAIKPSPNLPPIPGSYVSPQQWHALYAQGIILTNVSHSKFTQTQPPPPPGGSQIENFGSEISGMISMDSGTTFQQFSAPATVAVQVSSHPGLDSPSTRFFDTEMLALSLSGGTLPGGVMIRESPSKASLGRTSVRTLSSGFELNSFFDVFTEVSLDGGASWSPQITGPGTMGLHPVPDAPQCPSNITVYASSPSGAVVNYTINELFGDCPFGHHLSSTPPSGSTFPIGTTTVTVTAWDDCGLTNTCSFTVTVLGTIVPLSPEFFSAVALLPPPGTVYISPALWHALYNNGIVIRDVRHRFFTDHLPPPPLGGTQIHTFSSEVDYAVSFDNGATFQPGSGTASVQVKVTHTQDGSGMSFFDTEMLQLDLTGGGFLLRESPTLQSKGQTTVRQVGGGYMISSFFDVFTEISTDGGASWMPAQDSGHVELCNDPATVDPVGHPTQLLPPPNGVYISPQLWHALFAQGIVIKDVSHKFFTQSFDPPAAGSNDTHSFSSTLDMSVSTDGGNTFQSLRTQAPVSVSVRHRGSDASGFFDTEMLQLDATFQAGGQTLKIRESPTLPSRGATQMDAQSDGSYRIGSFFDIFPEISLDGGATWSAATNGPVRMQLTDASPEVPKPTPNLPPLDGSYISPAKWHALYANGIIITNASHDRFTQTQPPPPPGANQFENFGSRISGLISMNGGASFQPFQAPANLTVQVSSSQDSGATRFFDTEMLSLSLSGGTLPGGVMVRESPSKASLGRTSVRTTPGDYRIGSFFDVFTEVSLDGGNTWSPSITGPGTMALRAPSNSTASITLNCSSNITVFAAPCSNSAVVFFSSSATGGCPGGPVTVTCNPPSGSTFPLGTTTVTCIACDACGTCTNCSFTVTVLPASCAPLVLTCSTNITVTSSNCAGPNGQGATVFYSSSATGGCLPPPNVTCNPPSGSTFPIGTTTVTCTASDGCGNSTNCNFTVTVNPCPAVVLTCSSNIVVNATSCGANGGANVFYSSSVSGGCGPAGVSCNPPSGSFFPIGTTTVTCTAFDCGVVATNCSFTVTVNPPVCPPLVLTCSSNIVVNATNCSSTGVVVFYSSSASGGCMPPPFVTCNPPSGSTFPPGTTTVTCTATDGCGNSTNCNFTVTVNPCPAVVLTCSSNIVVNATNCGTGAGAVVFYSSSVSGGCGPAGVSCNPPSGSFFPIGTTTVSCSAFDCGVVATNCSFTVTVNPPVCPPLALTCSSNIVVNATNCGSSGSTVFYSSSATGGCGPVTVSCNPPSGSTFPPGTTTVTCTATDNCGNKTNCNFTVTVNGCPPVVLACSSNIVVNATNCGTGAGANVFYSSSVSGGCGPAGVSCNPPSGSFFAIGTTTVTCSAFDCGVVVTNCSFTVTVKPPVCPPIALTCSTNITVTSCSSTGVVVTFTSSATGGCAPTTVSCSPPSGSTFPANTSTLVTCTATDACGNTTNCTFAVTVQSPNCSPIVLHCPKKTIKVVAHKHFGAFVSWTSTATGGCPPTTVTCSPPSGSFFPIGTTLVTCTACDSCGNCTNCTFLVKVLPPIFIWTQTPVLPFTNTVYISPATWHALYAQGIVIRDVSHRFFTTGLLPPPLGTTQVHTFDSQLDFEISTDNGNTFQPVSAPGSTSVSVTHSSDDEGIESYDTEMLSLNLTGLPGGLMIRESPTLQSLGQTSIEPTPGGYMASSFFDIFTEVSLDNGTTWLPADDSASVEMRVDPRATAPGTLPSQLLPPPLGAYVSPQQWHALFAQGIVIKDVKHKFFTQSLQPPPPAGSNTHSFNSTVDMQISLDGGKNFQYARVAAPVQVTVSSLGSGNSGMYETEMTQLDLSGSALPGGLRFRESPSLPSRGGTQIDAQPDGSYRISSFFDIFPEVSLDGGNTWSPATNGPVRMELTPQAIEVPAQSGNLPVTNTPYVSPAQWHALYANGIIITNVTHSRFTQTFTPPPPGANQTETFGSSIDGQLSTDGGHTFTPFTAAATTSVQINSRPDQDSGPTRFFDTEMLSLDVQGLPNGIRFRESPTRASLGRTSIRTAYDGTFRISSFFDIFPEVSTDGGQTWLPSTTGPATMSPRLTPRKRFFPNPNLPPTNSQYISPKQWHALYANGIVISNVTHRRFLQNSPPPPKNSTNVHNFGSQVNFLLKMPGQQSFTPMTANADCAVSVSSSGFQSKEQVYQTEMLALNLSGGSLPPGVMIRESPTRRSTGESHYSPSAGGYRISSFFDVFTEISTDGGATWSAASSPGSMELHVDPGVPPTTVVNPRINNGTPTFTVQSLPGLKYLLQYKEDLLDPTWTTGNITPGTGEQLDLIDCCPPPGPGRPHRFYRVEVQEDDSY